MGSASDLCVTITDLIYGTVGTTARRNLSREFLRGWILTKSVAYGIESYASGQDTRSPILPLQSSTFTPPGKFPSQPSHKMIGLIRFGYLAIMALYSSSAVFAFALQSPNARIYAIVE
jgi:hypothetical protein